MMPALEEIRMILHGKAMDIQQLIEKHADLEDCHITRVMGTFVVVSNGRIVDMDRANELSYCPLQSIFSKGTIEDYVEFKMNEFGHFTPRREIYRSSIEAPFGTSEMLMYALSKKILDCAVVVCDGAGTVVTDNPGIVQGIGARMNGLFYTTPIEELRRRLEEEGCILSENAEINQAQGVKAACMAGYRSIGVTLNTFYGGDPADIRQIGRENGAKTVIASLCSTGADKQRAEHVSRQSDLSWACASGYMRQEGSKALLQITLGIPVFVFTTEGLEIIASYSDEDGASILLGPDKHEQRLVYSGSAGGREILLGGKKLRISSASLPVSGKHSPEPLT